MHISAGKREERKQGKRLAEAQEQRTDRTLPVGRLSFAWGISKVVAHIP